MSKDRVRIRYDGPALADHSIDVEDIAPALLAMGELFKIANRKFNGERAAVKVRINADLDQNCFELWVELAVSAFDLAKSLIKNDDIASAKELLEWIGILAPVSFGTVGLFELLKRLNGKQVSEQEVVVEQGGDVVQLNIPGDNNTLKISQQTFLLSQDPAAIQKIQKIVQPLTKEGYERLEFDDGEHQPETVDRDAAKSILTYSSNFPLLETPVDEPNQVVTAWIQVYSPVYDPTATSWRFCYGDDHYYMDISETDIAEKAMQRGGALARDNYKVRLEIRQTETASGRFKNHFKVIEVLEFKPAQLDTQMPLLKEDGDQ